MTWRTHVFFGISSLWLLAPLPPESLGYDFGTLAAFAALGALLPDLDSSESKIKHLKVLGTNLKPFMLPAQVVGRTGQQRGLPHSLAGLEMFTSFCGPLLWQVGPAPVASLQIGCRSHLVADSMTKSGVSRLYPSSLRSYLLPAALRVTTDSMAEEVLRGCICLDIIGVLLAQLVQ